MPDRTITKIERQKKNRHRVSIFLDGEFAFGANDEIVYRHQLAKGLKLSEERVQELQDYENFLAPKIAAMRFLARRLHSAAELKRKLLQKKMDAPAIDATINHLQSIGLINDTALAKAFVRDPLNFRPAGKKNLMNELRKRGVSEDIAKPILDELLHEDDEVFSARKIAEKYLARITRFDAATQKRRMFGYLMRKGYSRSTIATIVQELLLTNDTTEYET